MTANDPRKDIDRIDLKILALLHRQGRVTKAAMGEAVGSRAVPFLGVCVGMQLLADAGEEFGPGESVVGREARREGKGVARAPRFRVGDLDGMEIAFHQARNGHPALDPADMDYIDPDSLDHAALPDGRSRG